MDELDRTATGVRLLGQKVVHRLTENLFDRLNGHRYLTKCKIEGLRERGAALTTRPVTCVTCLWGELRNPTEPVQSMAE